MILSKKKKKGEIKRLIIHFFLTFLLKIFT